MSKNRQRIFDKGYGHVECSCCVTCCHYYCQVLAGQSLGGDGCCLQQWFALQKAFNSSEMSCGQKMQQVLSQGCCNVQCAFCLKCWPLLRSCTRWPGPWLPWALRASNSQPLQSAGGSCVPRMQQVFDKGCCCKAECSCC